MRKYSILALVAALLIAAPVFACDKDKSSASATPPCHKSAEAGAATVADQSTAKLPHLTYRVGDFETPCPKAAAAKAADGGQIVYVVGGETFDTKAKAMNRLAGLLEAEAAKMMTVSYGVGEETFNCPVEAKSRAEVNGGKVTYRLAGFDFNTREEADTVAATVNNAVAKLASSEGPPEPKPGCAGKAEGAAGHPGCAGKAKAQTASSNDGTADQPVAGPEKPSCGGAAKAEQASASDKPGCGGKAQTASGSEKPGCDKPCTGKTDAQTADAATPAQPEDAAVRDAEARVDAAMAKIEAIVRTAAAARQS